ncbi:hypothetical protein [Undibacterium sp. TJN19]|uniref:hypothetical protein n=1 Tax=Undibacterium sp. TJN19 TaxID=3413055 RepID=UPI003BF3F633
MKSAEIQNGIVTNIILGHMESHIPVDDTVSIGDVYNGNRFTKALPNAGLQRQAITHRIDTMEREDMCSRGLRELCLYLLEKEANEKLIAAKELSGDKQTDLSTHAFYLKLKSRDDQIVALRLQLSTLA